MSMMITDESNMVYTLQTSNDESPDAAVSEDDNAVCDLNLSEMGNELHHGYPFQDDNVDTFLHCGNENFYQDFFFVPLSEIYAEGSVEIVSEEYVDA
uniref:Reverse transcriptase domain-containing protein n=1 Tax=Angiostrongylus cantonensis TaxID=6313 RepID=A0A0K0CZ20_ANGCA